MIEAHNLTKRFNEFYAVRGVSLEVGKGQVLALLGPNGAGKTTTIRMITAILKPTSGQVSVAGYDVIKAPDKVRESVGVLTEHHGLYMRARGREYLDFFGELYGMSAKYRRERMDNLLARFGMAEDAERRIGEYSKGMRQKLSIIRAMLHDPPVLLLDEPTSAMDPESAKLVRDAITELRRDNRAILICTHNLNEAEELADKIAIIRQGEIIARGSPAELKRQLMGPIEMELRLAQSLNGLADDLSDMVDVSEVGDTWLRYRPTNAAVDNPRLLARLAAEQLPVVTLAEVPRSLESVYLRIIANKESVK